MSDVNVAWTSNEVVLHVRGEVCRTTDELLRSKLSERCVRALLAELRRQDSPLLELIGSPAASASDAAPHLVALLRALNEMPLAEVARRYPDLAELTTRTDLLHEFVEHLYNYWREFDRFLICHSESLRDGEGYDSRPYRTFNNTVEHLNHLVRAAYRDICENITGDHPRVYRQVSAGFQVGVIAVPREWPCPDEYAALAGVPLIRQIMLEPPLIIDPPNNTRSGQFERVAKNPLTGLSFPADEWLCYPARVGPLVIFVYFHQHFIALGCSLANLFELADDAEIARGPDAVYAFGVPAESLAGFGNLPTVFYDDERRNLLAAAVPRLEQFGYFGYLKKMTLTLHNVVMMKRGRLPFHGAMTHVKLKRGGAATVVLIGDTAAGKSEILEAFRVLGDEYIRQLRIVADDMGSFEIGADGGLRGYGTEIGAFVRLDDLQPGYAFGKLDRAIIMSPQKVNARAVLPVTDLATVLHGYSVDYLLYANNYQQVDAEHPVIDRFRDVEAALQVFREGAAMAKGTTSAIGLTSNYFANIFGPPQYRELHERLARGYFEPAFRAGLFVGQIRTRLGIPGYETRGPVAAARALFNLIAWKDQEKSACGAESALSVADTAERLADNAST